LTNTILKTITSMTIIPNGILNLITVGLITVGLITIGQNPFRVH